MNVMSEPAIAPQKTSAKSGQSAKGDRNRLAAFVQAEFMRSIEEFGDQLGELLVMDRVSKSIHQVAQVWWAGTLFNVSETAKLLFDFRVILR
jgi:hypothetical protein